MILSSYIDRTSVGLSLVPGGPRCGFMLKGSCNKLLTTWLLSTWLVNKLKDINDSQKQRKHS